MSLREAALALSVPLLWGTGFTIAKPAVEHFPPVFMMALIYAIAAIVMIVLPPYRRIQTSWYAAFVIALFGATFQASLIFSGLGELDASLTVLVVQTQVPFAVLASAVLVGEALQARKICGIAVAFSGVAIVAGLPDSPPETVPLMLVLLGAGCWGIGQALARQLGRDEGKQMLLVVSICAVPQLVVGSMVVEQGQVSSIQTADSMDWMALAYVGLGGFSLAYVIWYHLLSRCRVDEVTPFVLLMPLVGLVASSVLLNETISVVKVVGGVVIVFGLAIVIGVVDFSRRRQGADR